ncbi:MAG: PEP-CTERM sorting domain-containing protein [Verrucomicrobia subdivision 3 bacterium]|nr:PEP-CTERM sorting domain-containing protein [Limisphaerales bacterium]
MFKKSLLSVVVLSLATTAWTAIGGPYIGEQAVGWQTTSAVTVNSSDNVGLGAGYGVGGLLNGGAFEASVTGKLPFAGAGYNTDGWSHTSDPANNTWIANTVAGNSPAGIASSSWVQFTFDKVYSIKDITVWNGGMTDSNEYIPGRSWKDSVISWSTDGSSWSSMNYTFNQKAIEGSDYWFNPSDPAISFANDAKYVVFSGQNNYGNPYWMMSEVRFNLNAVPEPSTLALLGLGGLGFLMRRKR